MATLIRPSQINLVPTGFTLDSILDMTTTETAVSSTGKQTVYSISIPAATLGTNNLILAYVYGTISNSSGAGRTWTASLDYGATSLATTTTSGNINTGTSNAGYNLVAWLKGDGATNAQKGGIWQTLNNSLQDIGAYGTAAEDSTAAKSLTLSVTPSGATTTTTARVSIAIYYPNT